MLSLIDEVISERDLYKAYSHVNTIVFFIGYPRSRHSLLGSLLDAHPHMVISDETMAFNRWKARTDQWMQHSIYAYYDTMFRASHRAVSHGRRSRVFNDTVVNKSSAYGYYVPTQWQGAFDTYIEVKQFSFFFLCIMPWELYCFIDFPNGKFEYGLQRSSRARMKIKTAGDLFTASARRWSGHSA